MYFKEINCILEKISLFETIAFAKNPFFLGLGFLEIYLYFDEHIFPGLLAKLHVCYRQLGQLSDQPACGAGQDGSPCHLVLSPHQYFQQCQVTIH